MRMLIGVIFLGAVVALGWSGYQQILEAHDLKQGERPRDLTLFQMLTAEVHDAIWS